MCCLFTVLVFLGPRVALFFWWLFDQVRFTLAFGDNVLLGILGFIFLPWTTLMWVVIQPGALEGINWLWMGIALFADIATYAGGGYGNRNQIQGYMPSASDE